MVVARRSLCALLCAPLLLAGLGPGCGWRVQLAGGGSPGGAAGVSIPLPGPTPLPDSFPEEEDPEARAQRFRSQPYYKSWWFWSAIGLALIIGGAAAIAPNVGGSDRVARETAGRFDARSFPDR